MFYADSLIHKKWDLNRYQSLKIVRIKLWIAIPALNTFWQKFCTPIFFQIAQKKNCKKKDEFDGEIERNILINGRS